MLEDDMPRALIEDEARLLLSAAYGGRWRAIANLVAYEIKSAWERYAFMRFGWFRRRIFRRTPDQVLEIAEQIAQEDLESR